MTDIDDLSASLCRRLPCYLCGERAETVSTIVCDETGTRPSVCARPA